MLQRVLCAVFVSFVAADRAFAGDVVDFAASLIGRPYVWGAEGPRSFDCSGLTQYVFQKFGVDLPRRAVSQSKTGTSTGRHLRRGDLVFFASNSKRSVVTHVGIYEGDGMMIDASQRHGRVTRDHLDEPFWAERFMFARRVTDDRWSDQRTGQGEHVRREPGRSSNRRDEALRIIGRVAEALLKRPR